MSRKKLPASPVTLVHLAKEGVTAAAAAQAALKEAAAALETGDFERALLAVRRARGTLTEAVLAERRCRSCCRKLLPETVDAVLRVLERKS